ncbi:unnamed protein product [Adineta steineri]|uniref:Vacuolar protein sorting-associated protein 13 VPS13 adaptor binding domain-containing protein n=1 Tax=Adineta steineri TaxID=433720 RepID=A0A814D6R9_9BILA|nr:unnamed protein product [Adineta steineri]
MFETIIASLIKRYVAQYIDINADQLSAQLLYKQQIIIENLTLNETKLNEYIRSKFQLPLEIESIHIGKIQCSFILSSLLFRSSSSPAFIIKIEHVYIVIKDNIDESLGGEIIEENNENIKQNQLNLADQELEKEFECFGEVQSSKWNIQRLFMSFFEKLKVDIINVHIIYKNSTGYTIGLTCDNIQISTEPFDDIINRQIFRLNNLGIYLDINNSSAHSYILSLQNSMEISLKHNHFLVNQEEYHYEFECLINDLDIKCNIEQIRILINILHYQMLISDPYRPKSKISKQTARIWWHYIILRIRNNFWFNRSVLIHRLHQLNIYKRLYHQYLDSKYLNYTNISFQDEIIMKEIEKEFDVRDLLIIRRKIFQTRINQHIKQQQETTKWYFNYAKWITSKMSDLWGRTSSLNENDIEIQQQVNTFIEESIKDEDLLENYDSTRIFRFKIQLKTINIDLLSSSNNILWNFSLRNLLSMNEFRLHYQSMVTSIRLDDLCIRDHEQVDAFSTIIFSKELIQQDESQRIPVLEFLFEKKSKSKSTIKVRSCGLCIVCCPTSIERLSHLYTSIFPLLSLNKRKNMKYYWYRNCRSLLEQIMPSKNQKMTTSHIQHQEKLKLQIYVNIGGVKLILPLSSHDALIIDLSFLTLTNNSQDNSVFTQQEFEDDNDIFLTPISSPSIYENALEEESIDYPVNLLTTDQIDESVKYSSFLFSIHDIQVGYSNDHSQIVEKFNIQFIIQHSLDYLWPLRNISSELQKLTIHLNTQKIKSLYNSINLWSTFINNNFSKHDYQSNIWPQFEFRLNELNILLNDNIQTLCKINIENIDIALINNNQSKQLNFNLNNLMIGNDNEILLKINQTVNENNVFIKTNIDFLTTSKINIITDVNANKLDFIFNPKTICTLINFLSDMDLFSWNRIVSKYSNIINTSIHSQINIKFREINLTFIYITPVIFSSDIHIRNFMLNTLLNPHSIFNLTLGAIQISNSFNNLQQSTDNKQNVLIIGSNNDETSKNSALCLLLMNQEDNISNLSIKITSFSYFHSVHLINSIEQIFIYISENCHCIAEQESQKEDTKICLFNYLTNSTKSSILSLHRWILDIDIDTSIIIYPINIGLQLNRIHIKNIQNQLSDFEINVNRLDLLLINFTRATKINNINISEHTSWQFIENMYISFNFQLSNTSIMINSKLISPLRIYLSHNRIHFLREILNIIFGQNSTSLFKFIFQFQSSQMFIIFQSAAQYEFITICEAVLDQCQMLYELDNLSNKKILLQFNSLQIRNHLDKTNDFPIVLKTPSFIELNISQVDNQYEKLDVKLGNIDIKFIKLTWTILSEFIGIFDRENYSSNISSIEEKKKNSSIFFNNNLIKISINIDSIGCLLQDNETLLMNIVLQRFICQISTCIKQSIVLWTINSQLGFISIDDLTITDQLYRERLCTTATNAIDFLFTTEENKLVTSESNSLIGPQFYLNITSIQYIHTYYFLLRIFNYFDRFRQNEDFYKRLRLFIFKPVISNMSEQLNEILLNIKIENLILILPEHIQKKSVFIIQFGYMNLKNHSLLQNKSITLINQTKAFPIKSSRFDFISIEIKDMIFYIASHSFINQETLTSIHIPTYGFNSMDTNFLNLVRKQFNLNIEIEHNRNPTSPTYNIKINLSSIDILLDFNQYCLIENILIYTFNEQSIFMLKKLFNYLIVSNNDNYTNFVMIIEIDHIGMEMFLYDIDLLNRHSLGYTALMNLHISFEQYSNGDQILHFLCSTIKLLDTRYDNKDMIISLSMPSNSNQLVISLIKTKFDNQCTIALNSIRFLCVIDWLLELNRFINSFYQQETLITTGISFIPSFNTKLNLNQFELVLVSSITDPYSSALIYSSTMSLNYKQNVQSIECIMNDFTFLTCQIGNIDETIVSIIEPTDCSLNIHLSNEQICEFNIPILNIRISYSDIKMIYNLIHTIFHQISQVKTRKPLLTSISSILTSPIRDYQLLNIKFIKFSCNQICICFIDDCFDVHIPLLNINLKSFHFQTIENNSTNRIEQCQFEIIILYYNRFQSGFEPLIEMCSLEILLTRSSSKTSLCILSKELLNLNFTKAMYRLYKILKTNWYIDKQNSKKKTTFRHVKTLEHYCFKNLIGTQIKFRTWITSEQIFSSYEHIVDNQQTISFYFPTHSSQLTTNKNQNSQTRIRTNSIVSSLCQINRRLLISIDGWQCLQPISIDRIGTFYRIALPSNTNELYKPMIIIIDIAMTDNSIRLITVKSSIEIRNQLLTSIDIRFKCNLDLLHDFRLEPNEIYSLPIQLCSIIKQIQIRPSDFALDFCNEPITWLEINSEKDDNRKNSSSKENLIHRQSFLRSCSIDEKQAVYYICLQTKQTYLLNSQDHIVSTYQLSIHSPLTICNLLPCSLNYEIPNYHEKFEINPYKFHREHTLNILENIHILFSTNIYHMNKSFHLPTINDLYQTKYTHQRIIFYDNNQRELFIDITIVCFIKYRLKILLSVPYILLNKTGIPLIFKDINSKIEGAGQSIDDELEFNREALLFSFENSNRNHTCVMRIGTGLHRQQDSRPQWSQGFRLQQGSTYRQLQVRSSRKSTDWNYSIAIDIRSGNGFLKKINFIFLSPRYMIYNQCSYNLLITQRQILNDETNYKCVSQHATIAYHWPRIDIEQLLCVKIINNDNKQIIHWSGGFPIDCVNAFHINMRYDNGQCLILRVQIIERNGTFFVVFMDSNQMPPPFRITNRSDIPIQFHQTDIRPESTHLYTSLLPHQLIDYAWDELTLKPTLTCSIIDGTKTIYDLFKLGNADELHYQNLIYLVFQVTYEDESLSHSLVVEYNDNQLFVAQRQENQRSQLWYRTDNGILIHIGSLSIQDGTKKKDFFDDLRHTFVLDIQDPLDNNLTESFTQLTVKRYDPKRLQTQSWQFTDSGYLCLKDTHLCVQIFGELKEKSDIVLGPILDDINEKPLSTMYIRAHQRYKGIGILYANVVADGPTNVLEIDHIKSNNLPNPTSILSSIIYHIDLHFSAGVGISIINSMNHQSEELMYILVNNLHIEYNNKNNEQSIESTIDTLIIGNQLLTTTKPCLLYINSLEDPSIQRAIRFQIQWQKSHTNFSLLHIIHSLQIGINSITIQLDELLLWKLIDFFDIEISSLSSLLYKTTRLGNNTTNSDRKIDLNINDYETERILSLLTSTHATRIYFNKLSLSSIDLNLSVYCIHSKRLLSSHLLTIKRHASFPLVPFENAQIHLKSYEQTHIFNTYDFFLLSIITHYVNVCTRQALKILGTVDFLGNPLGLLHDVTDGIACLVDQRGVSGLVKNVAHGVADSTSKVTGSLSHGIGKLVSDNEHYNRRQSIIDNHKNPTTIKQVIRHGTAGIAAGFYDGLTSMIKQPYKGVVEQGMPGLVKGFAKGIVGTVSKPMVSILDFTNEMATVIKEGARSPNIILNTRIRPTRCPSNILGLLQSYSIFDAQGHYLLYRMNKGDLTERYISRLTISTTQINTVDKRNKNTSDRIKDSYIDAMITTQRVIIYRIDDDPDLFNFEIIDSYDFNTSMAVIPIEDADGCAFIQISIDSTSSNRLNNNILHRCDTLEQALLLSQDIQRAQEIFQEEKMIYIIPDDETENNYNDIIDDQQTE